MGIEGNNKKTSLRNFKLWSFNSCNGNVGTEWYNSWIFQLHPNIPLVSNWSTIASPLETKRVGQLNEHFHPFLWQRCADVFFFSGFQLVSCTRWTLHGCGLSERKYLSRVCTAWDFVGWLFWYYKATKSEVHHPKPGMAGKIFAGCYKCGDMTITQFYVYTCICRYIWSYIGGCPPSE